MLMNITGITLTPITQIPNCNFKDCRTRIAEYVSRNWVFHSDEFVECKNCPDMVHTADGISFSSDWLMMWLQENFFIKKSIGQDCEENPIKGTMQFCMLGCFIDTTCAGFSRQKNIEDDDKNGECWLKTNITVNQIPDDPEWHTVVFNT